MIKVVLLGKYREQVGISELQLSDCADFEALSKALLAVSPQFDALLADKRLLLAVNHHLQHREQFCARNGDEVALMPPVTGG